MNFHRYRPPFPNTYIYPNPKNSPYPYCHRYIRPFPPVDSALLKQSAMKMQELIHDTQVFLQLLTTSPTFANQLMSAAQESNTTEVTKLIKQTGIQTTPTITYNPDGIHLEFKKRLEQIECCQLVVKLRWRIQ